VQRPTSTSRSNPLVFPGFQFLPLRLKASTIQRWPLIRARPTQPADALRRSLAVELLSRTRLASYSPDSEIEEERSRAKALIARRRSRPKSAGGTG